MPFLFFLKFVPSNPGNQEKVCNWGSSYQIIKPEKHNNILTCFAKNKQTNNCFLSPILDINTWDWGGVMLT